MMSLGSYLELLRDGAWASIGACVLGLVVVVMLAVVLSELADLKRRR